MLIHNGLPVPQTFADVCRPDRMALLVYDMQIGIAAQLPDPAPLLAACQRAIATARATGMRIVFLRHMSAPRAWMGAFQMRMGLLWQRKSDPADVSPWFLRDSQPWQIVPELQPTSDDIVLDKLGMSAFEGTPLEFLLRDCGLSSLAIIGAAIEIGIEPTVRHAADLGIVPVLLTDACAGGHAEAADRSLESLRFMGDAMFATIGEFEAALRSAD